jgi:CheY-like chemotaxis protein
MRTILLIDDDAEFRREIEKMLVGASYRVIQAPDGIRAIRLIEEMRDEIDLAIVDLALPGLNGFELIGALSRRPNSVKILATTTVFNDSVLDSTTALGAHATMRKPRVAKGLPHDQWLNTIQQLIGGAEAARRAD